jgi:DNA primase
MYQHLDVVQEGANEECCCVCPFCGGKTSLQFNDEKGLWICFKCGEKGTARTLVQMLEGTYTEPEVDLAQISAELRSLECSVSEPAKPLADSYLARFCRPGVPSEHWIARGFDEVTCARWELGYDFLGDRLTLPYRDPFTRKLAGIIFRAVGQVEGPRYKFPFGFARSGSLYGSWLVGSDADAGNPADEVVIGEGPTDAIKIGQTEAQAVAQYGSSISTGQVRLLHRLGIRRIVLFYDYDRAGLRATEKGIHLAESFDVERVVWDRDEYCWHTWICGCRKGNENHDTAVEHTSAGNCWHPRRCKCGRTHEPDPGSLEPKTIDKMLGRTVGV